MNTTRKPHLASVRSIVIKLGTQLLSDREGRLDTAFIATIAEQVTRLRDRKITTTIVSSGAIGAGLRELGIAKRPTDLAMLQAVAAVGQRRLMDVWADAFEPFKLHVAQLLLTREDVDDRTRYLNLRNTLNAAHELGAIPIINENDTVSTDELVRITFGDNDILASLVAGATQADLLVLLSVVDGILDATGKPVRLVDSVAAARELVRADKSPLGKGGMNSKLDAAKLMTTGGRALVVADGRTPDVLSRLLDAEEIGTLFIPSPRRRRGRSSWITAARPVGVVVVDAGAVSAIVQKNRSLLPAGINRVEGEFDRGDVIAVHDAAGTDIAHGLTNYPSSILANIIGKKTAEVRALLAEQAYDEVIHRDNLAIC